MFSAYGTTYAPRIFLYTIPDISTSKFRLVFHTHFSYIRYIQKRFLFTLFKKTLQDQRHSNPLNFSLVLVANTKRGTKGEHIHSWGKGNLPIKSPILFLLLKNRWVTAALGLIPDSWNCLLTQLRFLFFYSFLCFLRLATVRASKTRRHDFSKIFLGLVG